MLAFTLSASIFGNSKIHHPFFGLYDFQFLFDFTEVGNNNILLVLCAAHSVAKAHGRKNCISAHMVQVLKYVSGKIKGSLVGTQIVDKFSHIITSLWVIHCVDLHAHFLSHQTAAPICSSTHKKIQSQRNYAPKLISRH